MNKKVLIVAANYYKEISENLIKGASNILNDKNISYQVIYATGSFEIPFLINRNINSYDGFIALGCIIRGETYHFELLSNEVTRKIMDLSISCNKPIGFGIITCENMDQATSRSNPDPFFKKNNKGTEAAIACVDLLSN